MAPVRVWHTGQDAGKVSPSAGGHCGAQGVARCQLMRKHVAFATLHSRGLSQIKGVCEREECRKARGSGGVRTHTGRPSENGN